MGFMDVLVPSFAFLGYRYVGNGSSDALDYLDSREGVSDGIDPADIARIIEKRGPPNGPIDYHALVHDLGSATAQTTMGQIANDLKFAFNTFGDFLSNPFGNFFGAATFAFGWAAAGFHGAVGAISAIGSWIGSAVGHLFDFLESLFPVVIDLDGDGVELTALDHSHAKFDFNDDGVREHTGWVGADDALLAFDADTSGTINAAKEIAFVHWKADAKTDLEGLSHFDANGDGVLSAADAKAGGFDWSQFVVWRDANGDGVSQNGELRTLNEAGVSEIDLHLNGKRSDVEGNVIANETSVKWADGHSTSAADVAFLSEKYGLETQRGPDGVVSLETNAGVRSTIVDKDARGLALNGSEQNDLFVFGNFANVSRIAGGGGSDMVLVTGEYCPDNVRIAHDATSSDWVVTDTVSGASFQLSFDIEEINIGGRQFHLDALLI